ncbi:1571e770-a987-4de7-8883-52fcf4d277bb [Thermothielavioides terrestris]|uniref:1571e770-a987-4de7-8883-52fcf4d277bb n=1 Tax=Thermothielavioides terrestris TaxID=2587410 RepID=A0A446BXH7_9PEZI|nr:1571e770-a987-4de7-8883-52fcf4d277bb [Thermothielavioides terrestris]
MPPERLSRPLDWRKHEDEILDLLTNQQKTLREVMEHIERQYKYRFGRLKYVSSDEWALIADELRRRAVLGKKTVVYLQGQPLPMERVSRGIARSQKKGSASRVQKRTADTKRKPQDAARITFRTPSPAPLPASGCSLETGNEPNGPLGRNEFAASMPSLPVGSPQPTGASPGFGGGAAAWPMQEPPFDWLDDAGMVVAGDTWDDIV